MVLLGNRRKKILHDIVIKTAETPKWFLGCILGLATSTNSTGRDAQSFLFEARFREVFSGLAFTVLFI